MICKDFYDDMYRFPWLLCIGGNRDEAYNKLMKKLGLPPDDEESESNFVGNFVGCFLANSQARGGAIWLHKEKANHGVIAHECYHGANYVLQTCGISPALTNNDEHYAYYLEWLFKKVAIHWDKYLDGRPTT